MPMPLEQTLHTYLWTREDGLKSSVIYQVISLQKVFHDLMGFLQATAVILTDVERGQQYPKGLRELSRATLERMNELLPHVQYFYQLASNEAEKESKNQ